MEFFRIPFPNIVLDCITHLFKSLNVPRKIFFRQQQGYIIVIGTLRNPQAGRQYPAPPRGGDFPHEPSTSPFRRSMLIHSLHRDLWKRSLNRAAQPCASCPASQQNAAGLRERAQDGPDFHCQPRAVHYAHLQTQKRRRRCHCQSALSTSRINRQHRFRHAGISFFAHNAPIGSAVRRRRKGPTL